MSEESIKSSAKSVNSINPGKNYIDIAKIRVKFGLAIYFN